VLQIQWHPPRFMVMAHSVNVTLSYVLRKNQPGVQNRAEDWSLCSRGCFDAVSLTRLQMQLRYDFNSVAEVRDVRARFRQR